MCISTCHCIPCGGKNDHASLIGHGVNFLISHIRTIHKEPIHFMSSLLVFEIWNWLKISPVQGEVKYKQELSYKSITMRSIFTAEDTIFQQADFNVNVYAWAWPLTWCGIMVQLTCQQKILTKYVSWHVEERLRTTIVAPFKLSSLNWKLVFRRWWDSVNIFYVCNPIFFGYLPNCNYHN